VQNSLNNLDNYARGRKSMTGSCLFNPHLDGDPFYWEAGPIGILLIHGFTATTAEVRPIAKKFFEQGYTVAGPLLAGHGTTPEDLNETSWTAWARSAEQSFQKLKANCQEVLVTGESAGAVICLYLASEHPEISHIILAAPAIKLNLSPAQVLEVRLLAPFVKTMSKGKMGNSKNWQGYYVNPLKGVLQLMRLEQEVLARLPRIRQPILIFQGRHDRTINPCSGEIILGGTCSRVKKLVWMENSSHVVMLDPELDQVAETAVQFIHEN
jgi:carboxylesterase